MKVSKLADYGIVLLSSYYGTEDEKLSVPNLAERTKLAEPTVSKVMKLMAANGVVTSTRGASGGYSLSKPLEHISVLDVIEAIDGSVSLTACVDGAEDCCSIINICGVQGRWAVVNNMIRNALNEITILDMIHGGEHISLNEKIEQKVR